ncbi:histidine-rich glycoprotein-like [Trichoplusia ni]|uniref:Histidine-rich glycoprotein-like n=1 Tax=Trichoplusia ni TaxID=7111 RepID=A0A7E5WHC5_TRINI|nr:histidine-rich glycoprotein-like [Trichoplusia ni]
MLKIVALIAFIGACGAIENGYSSQSFHFGNHRDRHDNHQQDHHRSGDIRAHTDHHDPKKYHGLGVIRVLDQNYGHDEHHDHEHHDHIEQQDNVMHEKHAQGDVDVHDEHNGLRQDKAAHIEHRTNGEDHINNYLKDKHHTLGVIYVPDEHDEDDDDDSEHHQSNDHELGAQNSFHGHDKLHHHHEDFHDHVEHQSQNDHYDHKEHHKHNENHHAHNDHVSEHKIELSVQHIVEHGSHQDISTEPDMEEHNIKLKEMEQEHVGVAPVMENNEDEIHKKPIVPVKIAVPVAHYVQSDHHEQGISLQHMNSHHLAHPVRALTNHGIDSVQYVFENQGKVSHTGDHRSHGHAVKGVHSLHV